MMNTTQRGFALLIAVILTSVVLALGEALLDVAYKQILLSSSAKNSQYAFYNADSALECALYWDQKLNAFDYATPLASGSITCNSTAIQGYTSAVSGGTRITTFAVACSTGAGSSASVTAYKQSGGTTDIYANGYNSCDATSATRIERGLKVHY
jgi:Tfp pilus assembly protein PilX